MSIQSLRKLLFMLCLGQVLPAEADDRIVVRSASGGRMGVSCTVIDYTGKGVVYQIKAGGGSKRLSRAEILEVTTQYTAPHLAAQKLLDEGAAREAFQHLETALAEEKRVWVRRQILALQVNCALWQGDLATAGIRFLAIVESDPSTFYYAQIPLSWSEAEPSAELIPISQAWLKKSDEPAAQLLGASHLLTEPAQTAVVLRTLKELARNEHPEIQRLAQFQLWRARVLTEDVSADELLRWERTFDEAGEGLTLGTRYILGLGWQRRRDDASAAAAWLWLHTLNSPDRWLAAQAAKNAAEALSRAGQMSEAKTLRVEITQRYADTPAGKSITSQ